MLWRKENRKTAMMKGKTTGMDGNRNTDRDRNTIKCKNMGRERERERNCLVTAQSMVEVLTEVEAYAVAKAESCESASLAQIP